MTLAPLVRARSTATPRPTSSMKSSCSSSKPSRSATSTWPRVRSNGISFGTPEAPFAESGAAQPLQLRRRQRERALQLELEASELERGFAECAELLAHEPLVERFGSRGLERHRALDARGAAEIVASGDDQRRACCAAHAQREADLSFPSRDALHLARDLGVLGLPDHVARLHQAQIQRTLVGAAEEHPQQPRPDHVARMQAAARLVVLRLSLVEEDSIARLQFRGVRFRAHQHAAGPGMDLLDAADQDAPVAGIEAVHQRLVIGTTEKTVREAAR